MDNSCPTSPSAKNNCRAIKIVMWTKYKFLVMGPMHLNMYVRVQVMTILGAIIFRLDGDDPS